MSDLGGAFWTFASKIEFHSDKTHTTVTRSSLACHPARASVTSERLSNPLVPMLKVRLCTTVESKMAGKDLGSNHEKRTLSDLVLALQEALRMRARHLEQALGRLRPKL
eukprot:669122-Amphidinium_carterae.1